VLEQSVRETDIERRVAEQQTKEEWPVEKVERDLGVEVAAAEMQKRWNAMAS
jgi:hypothetical protein